MVNDSQGDPAIRPNAIGPTVKGELSPKLRALIQKALGQAELTPRPSGPHLIPPSIERVLADPVRLAEILKRDLYFVRKVMGDSKKKKGESTIGGLGPEDVVDESIYRILNGNRCVVNDDLLLSLMWTNMSVIKHARDARIGIISDEEIETTEAASDGDSTDGLTRAELLAKIRNVMELIKGEVPDLAPIIDAIACGIDKAADISTITGIPVEQIYVLTRKLRRHIKRRKEILEPYLAE